MHHFISFIIQILNSLSLQNYQLYNIKLYSYICRNTTHHDNLIAGPIINHNTTITATCTPLQVHTYVNNMSDPIIALIHVT